MKVLKRHWRDLMLHFNKLGGLAKKTHKKKQQRPKYSDFQYVIWASKLKPRNPGVATLAI